VFFWPVLGATAIAAGIGALALQQRRLALAASTGG
jgi:hypothetical protein